jgi:hypothetical protein
MTNNFFDKYFEQQKKLLSKMGHINFWVDTKKYNHIENTHQFLLLSFTDATS